MPTRIPTHLTDPQLIEALKRAVRDERGATALLVAHLAEMDARTLHLGLGFSSLFDYCCDELRLSESATCKRIEVARAARRFPVLLERLADGSLSLSSARLLAPKLTDENHRELIAAAAGRRKRAVEEMLARRFPKPDVATLVRKLPMRAGATLALASADGIAGATAPARTAAESAPTGALALLPTASGSAPAAPDAPNAAPLAPSPASPPRPLATPLSADRYQIRFTASAATWKKLQVARELLRHAVPSGDAGEIFDRALTALIDDLAKKEARGGEEAAGPPAARDGGRVASHPGEGEARGLEARQGTLRVRRRLGTAVRGARPPGAPSHRAVRGRRRGHGREHPAPLPRAQRLRGGPVLRSARGRAGKRRAAASGRVRVERARLNRPRGRLSRRRVARSNARRQVCLERSRASRLTDEPRPVG